MLFFLIFSLPISAEKKDYALFASRHSINGELLKQGHKMEAMSKWCKAMEISVTPTIFINGYQLPDAYSIEDSFGIASQEKMPDEANPAMRRWECWAVKGPVIRRGGQGPNNFY